MIQAPTCSGFGSADATDSATASGRGVGIVGAGGGGCNDTGIVAYDDDDDDDDAVVCWVVVAAFFCLLSSLHFLFPLLQIIDALIILEEFSKEVAAIALVKYHLAS